MTHPLLVKDSIKESIQWIAHLEYLVDLDGNLVFVVIIGHELDYKVPGTILRNIKEPVFCRP